MMIINYLLDFVNLPSLSGITLKFPCRNSKRYILQGFSPRKLNIKKNKVRTKSKVVTTKLHQGKILWFLLSGVGGVLNKQKYNFFSVFSVFLCENSFLTNLPIKLIH